MQKIFVSLDGLSTITLTESNASTTNIVVEKNKEALSASLGRSFGFGEFCVIAALLCFSVVPLIFFRITWKKIDK